MERSVDKINVKAETEELISLFYKIELKFFIDALLYEHYQGRGSINT